MEVSPLIKSSRPSCPSPDGQHIINIDHDQLYVRRVITFEIIRSIRLPVTPSRCISLRWCPVTKGAGVSNRFLLADEDTVRIWDLQDTEWSATIDNGSGGMGKIANAEFGADDTEVLVFSSFNAQVTIWSLWTGRSVEIKDPKFAAKGHGRHKNFALLSRPSAHDVVTIHAPQSYSVLRTFTPPTTDAQGLKWSPDGRWLALWDTSSMGYKVFIYTADGNLYRTYAGDYFEDDLKGLGVKTLEWSPNGDFLAIAGFEKSIKLLSTRTFSPAVCLAHVNTVSASASKVYTEQATPVVPCGRIYTAAGAPTSPPTATTSQNDKPAIGASILSFNSSGSLLASKDDAHPTTVWVWDLATLQSRAVFIQHALVKKFSWHPTNPDLLLIQCVQGDALLYSWDAGQDQQPDILHLPSECRLSAKADARWVRTHKRPTIFLGDTNSSVIVWPDGREPDSPNISVSGRTYVEDEDSVYEALSGMDNAQKDSFGSTKNITEDEFDYLNGSIQDTFDFRRGVSAC